MPTETINKTLQIINGLFSDSHIKEADMQFIRMCKAMVHELSVDDKKAMADHILTVNLPKDNPIALYFFLFDMFDDARFIEHGLDYFGKFLPPQTFNELFWSLTGSVFIGKTLSTKVTQKLREYHQKVSSATNASLDDIGARKKKVVSKVRNVAIISPQILSMRHAPTREAFNIALNLEHDFDCTCYVFNTNGFSYDNDLGLIDPYTSNSHKDLKGGLEIKVDYMQFTQKSVRVISFEAQPMTTRKLFNIVNALAQFNIDAVIAHGENLLVQEAVYGILPSIFATTGDVVPYAHSDAYFVPGHLYAQEHQQLAEKYQHSHDFLKESMLVTPEGKEEGNVSKSEFGIPNDRFVYLVVSTRLNEELCAEFIEACKHILERSPNSVIALAGTRLFKLENYFDAPLIESGQVVDIGFQENLPRACKMADVYLNPLRLGGGTSSQTAILNGLPIVTRDHGHISAVVPEGLRHASWRAYIDFAIELKENTATYETWQARLEQHFIDHLDARTQIAKIYHKLCDIAQQQYAS